MIDTGGRATLRRESEREKWVVCVSVGACVCVVSGYYTYPKIALYIYMYIPPQVSYEMLTIQKT